MKVFIFIFVLALAACNTSPQRTAEQERVEIEVIAFEKANHRNEEMLRLIDDTFERIRRGEDFRALATRVSDLSFNDKQQWVDTKFLLHPIQDALRHLEPGETSDLIVTDKCYLIVKLFRRSEVNPRQ